MNSFYHSTRSKLDSVTSKQAILRGIAPDGGLYVADWIGEEKLDLAQVCDQTFQENARVVLSGLLPDFTAGEIADCVSAAYGEQWDTPACCPVSALGDDWLLELYHGPTSAFKDVALSMLPHLMTAAKKKCGVDDEILILTATSGDTGKAAMEGFCDVAGTKIIVFYPDGGVSAVQKAQMVTQGGDNTCVAAVRGNFDDAQTAVKQVFAKVGGENLLAGKGVRLSSANSINIGRLAPQVVYYFRAYADLVRRGTVAVGERVDYVVPTGNFGDILAGYFARELGLPVGTLVCASNANNVLTDFIRTGRYDKKRPFYLTSSPSMDILVSSNLERLLFLLSGDEQLVAKLMRQLTEDGAYEVPEELKEKIQSLFWAGCCGDDETKQTIGRVWQEHHYLCDTHTAVAWNVAQQYKAANPAHAPVVVLSTASPYKFPAAVLEGLGEKAEGDEFAVMEQLERLTGIPAPKNLRGLRERPVRHTTVLDREEMLPFVLEKAQEKKWF